MPSLRVALALFASVVMHAGAFLALSRMAIRPASGPPDPPIAIRIVPIPAGQSLPTPVPRTPSSAPRRKAKSPPAPMPVAQPVSTARGSGLGPTGNTGPKELDSGGEIPGGTEGGVPDGGPGPSDVGSTPPGPSRAADLAMIQSAIRRTLSYPAAARRAGWQGRVELAFVLLADGRVRDLVVKVGSGHEILDDAAVAAIRDAAPFAPPGQDVSIVIPLRFRLH